MRIILQSAHAHPQPSAIQMRKDWFYHKPFLELTFIAPKTCPMRPRKVSFDICQEWFCLKPFLHTSFPHNTQRNFCVNHFPPAGESGCPCVRARFPSTFVLGCFSPNPLIALIPFPPKFAQKKTSEALCSGIFVLIRCQIRVFWGARRTSRHGGRFRR